MILVLTGVTGVGKTTIGQLLAQKLHCRFIEADDYHSPDAIRKMTDGIPLTDTDRQPWLTRIEQIIRSVSKENETVVIACSALKKSYRDILSRNSDSVRFIHLHGRYDLIHKRLQGRKGHFAKAELLKSQFAACEDVNHSLHVDISKSPQEIVETIRRNLPVIEGETASKRFVDV
jgi:gluconokinase